MGKYLLKEESRLKSAKKNMKNNLFKMTCDNCSSKFTPGKWRKVGKAWMHDCWGTGRFYLACEDGK